MSTGCIFCKIVSNELSATVIFEDDLTFAFLDHRPLFPGHCLLVSKEHFETLADLPTKLVAPVFHNVQLLSQAVEHALEAEGSFVALNNRVSQSVPHLHVHIVPRRKGDGLRGFFWPRTKYSSNEEMTRVRDLIKAELKRLNNAN